MAVAKEGYSIEFTYNSMMLFAFEDHVFVAPLVADFCHDIHSIDSFIHSYPSFFISRFFDTLNSLLRYG